MPSHAKTAEAPINTHLPAAEDKRRSSLIEIVTLAALSVVGVIALLPNTDEKTAALIADKRFPQAIVLLETRAHSVPLNSYETFSLAKLYREVGEGDKATTLLEGMLVSDPTSDQLRRELAALYRAAQRPADEIRILQGLFKHTPDAATSDRLIVLYRSVGDAAGAEAQLLDAQHFGFAPVAPPSDVQIVPANLTDSPPQAI